MAKNKKKKTPTVDQAMIAVMREIGPVGKNSRNQSQGYDFRAHEDIVAAARGPMATHGLRMLPRVVQHNHFTRGQMNVAVIEVEYTFRGPAGDEMPPILVIGEGADPADKASSKAMTAAEKYAFLQAFKITGADDGDRDHPAGVRSPLDRYIEQIKAVQYNAEALRGLAKSAAAEGVADHRMPNSEQTLRQMIDDRVQFLLAEKKDKEERRARERKALGAQMRAQHPDPAPAGDRAEPGPQPVTPPSGGTGEPAPGPLPDPAAPQDPAPARTVSTGQGTPDAGNAIIVAPTPGNQAPDTQSAPPAGPAPQPPAADEPPAPGPAPRRMTAAARARADMIAEAGFQAKMLGVDPLDFVSDLLPKGRSDVSMDDIRGGSRLQSHVLTHRPQVLEALAQRGMTDAAEAYSAFGDRVPARNISQFIDSVQIL